MQRVLASGWYILGEEVAAFEEEYAKWLGSNFAVGVANGTDAIELALRTFDIGAGDIVITVSHTAVATVAAIERTGARAMFVDIEPGYYTMCPSSLENAITQCQNNPELGKLKAVIPVHLYGNIAAIEEICEIANNAGLAVIEDCAQAHGAELGGKTAGTFGDFATFSFYPTKNLGAFGDGGMVTTDNPDYNEKLRALRQYGWGRRQEE